ncbi:MAG TPA: glycerophosphodiester phosphodiesterase family protein [Elusimicrobiota bacterium]|jgi:glycerophosphoryl diester phosphodiesterase|nr:glycerophosphodiester phosphodiesterase family protein [Elusimicrobiota bacterium]
MLVIAHRGASGHAPENTLAAFRLALEMGARAVEFDVHQTLDHELVVGHDDDLKRCGGDRRRMKNLHWAGEAEKIDVGSWFDKRFAGERLPRLDDVFDLVPPSVELHLEIKHGSSVYPGIEERVVDLLHRRGGLRRTLVSSFDHAALYSVRSLDEKVRLGYLLGLSTLRSAFKEMKELSAESLNMSARQTTARAVKAAHDRGCKVLVYTVNAPAERDRLAALGVDGIFCNYPELDLWGRS